MSTSENLIEYAAALSATSRIDRAANCLRGVKVLGLNSTNGRQYTPTALEQAVPLYANGKVNINHPKGAPHGPRDYQDRLGHLQNVRYEPARGLYADLCYNPRHPLAEQLLWDAEHAPSQVGLSHNVMARTRREGETLIVEEILSVQSVDLVADPATTRGLFEAEPSPTLEVIAPAAQLALLEADNQRLQAELQSAQTAERLARRRLLIARALRSAGLPDPAEARGPARAIVDDAWLEALENASCDEDVRELVRARAELLWEARRWGTELATQGSSAWEPCKSAVFLNLPRSREQGSEPGGPAEISTTSRGKAFARALLMAGR
ncbi:MAG: hypothetical protein SFX18_01685 [Pirellulales bacterium]|nr:hypothetical protein [Pirellulales bacterium]